MDRHELQEIKKIQEEIRSLEYRILHAGNMVSHRMNSDTVKGSSKRFPYEARIFKVTGLDDADYQRRVKQLRKHLRGRVDALMDAVTEANKYIESLPDAELRAILALRYINGMSWQQIAASLGVEGDGSGLRKKCDRFMKYYK